MTRIARALFAALAISVVSAPLAAHAQETTTTTATRRPEPVRVDELKRRCLAQIDKRVTALDARQRELNTARHLTAEHKAALDADINTTRDGLKALAVRITDETDPVALRRECESIWTSFRVFALVLPRTRLVTTADAELFAVAKLTDIAARLESAGASGEDLDAMKAKIASASAAASSVAPSILPLTPADWNANHDVLKPAHNSVRTARADLKAAAELGRKIAADLRA
jgi:hypothetical protein